MLECIGQCDADDEHIRQIGFAMTFKGLFLLPAANVLGRAIRQRGCGRRRAIYFPPNRCDELAALLVSEWLDILPGHFDYDA